MWILFKSNFVSSSYSGDVDQELVVVVGGETEGVSREAKMYTHSNLGERLFVPLKNEVDSLNVACAASVILFEIAKAFGKKKKA